MYSKTQFDEAKQCLIRELPDFVSKIAPIYKLLNWTWEDKGIPTEMQILKEAMRLVNTLKYQEIEQISCGGLNVYVEEENTLHYITIQLEIQETVYL